MTEISLGYDNQCVNLTSPTLFLDQAQYSYLRIKKERFKSEQLYGVAAFPEFSIGYGQIRSTENFDTPLFLEETEVLVSKAKFKT